MKLEDPVEPVGRGILGSNYRVSGVMCVPTALYPTMSVWHHFQLVDEIIFGCVVDV